MERLNERLRKKGWTKREIEKTVKLIENVRASKTRHIIAVEKTSYWAAFIIIVFGNFLISFSLIPLIIVLDSSILFSIVILLGLVFGFLAETLMRDISHLQKHHHLLFGIIIPLTAIFTAFIIASIAESEFSTTLFNKHPPSAVAIGIVYAVSFILPYLFYNHFRKMG